MGSLPDDTKALAQPDRGLPVASVKIGGEIVFVDSGVSDLGTLLAGIREGVEVVVLDPSRDALTQIAEALARRSDLSAVHIIANGGAGRIDFKSGSIDGGGLGAHAADLAAIGAALAAGGDLLIWSCDTGAGAPGAAFIDALALATGVDVAASTGPTGAAARGGDWVLELRTGAIDASAPLTGAGIAGYAGLLDDEPDGTDATLIAFEDTDYAFSAADFGFDDGVEGNDFIAVVITTLPGTGALYLLDGVGGEAAVTDGQTILIADINAGLLIYRPEPDGNGAGYAGFTFQVQDDGGSNDLDTSPNMIVFDVTSVNDAPYLDLDFTDITAGGLDSATSWQEGDAPVALAFAVELDDDDTDNSYPGATVTAAFTANGTPGDRLVILSAGDGPGEIRVDGANVYYQGTLVGSFTGGTDGSTPLVVTFNADACHCAVQTVIASIAFDNVSDAPDTSQRTVTITFVDGGGTADGGADTASANVTIDVSGVNDAPTVAIDAPMLPVDGEMGVNTTTAGPQQDPKIAALDDGGYVILWSSTAADFSDVGIFARIYDADGTPRTGEFLIDSLGQYDITNLSVSALDGGGFVVAWQDVAPTLGRYVAAQRFDSLGDPISVAVPVTAPGAGGYPVVTGLSGGGYVVTWLGDDGAGIGIHAMVFDSADTAIDGSFIANVTTTGTQTLQSVAGLADGGFVITWTSFNLDSDFTEVYARRFDAAGDPVGGEFLVPTAPTGDQSDATVTGLAGGGFVITWTQAPSFADVNVRARLYDASGNPVGSEFAVTAPSGVRQGDPTVTALAGGGFAISWQANDVTGTGDTYVQRYDASGSAVGSQIRITEVTLQRHAPVIAGLADGGFALAWTSMGQDGDSAGIYSRAFAPTIAVTEQVAHDLKGSITLADVDDSGGIYTVTLSVTEGVLDVDPGTSGALVDDSDQQNIVITGTLAQIQALLGSDPASSVTYTYDDDYLPAATIEFTVTIDDGIGSAIETVTIGVTPVNDAADLDLDYMTPGNDAVATYVVGDPATPIAYYATFDDDNSDWDGATLTIAITGATADDQLSIDDSLLFDVTVVGNDILYQGDGVGSWSGGAGGAALVITFNANACACAIEQVVYGIAYTNSSATPAPGTRDVTFTFVDGGGTANGGVDTATATVKLTVTVGPTPPVIDEGAAASGDEDAPIALTGIVITDAGDPVTGLVTVQLEVANGTITIRTDVIGGIEASDIIGGVNGGRGITITATPAEINATLAASGGLIYQGNADYNGADALNISVHDGTPATALAISSLSALPFGLGPTAVAVADIDGDFLDDLILGLEADGGDPGFILTLAGGFGGAPLPALSPEAFAFGDFDGDGEIDIAFAAYDDAGDGYVGYLSSDTGDVVVIDDVPYALDLVAADFNDDGLMDLAVADSDNGRVGIILQTAPGVFAAPAYSASSGMIANGIRTGDFNGDGKLDLLVSYYGAVGSYAPPGSVAVMLGNGDGTFGTASPVWSGPSNVGGIVVGDFNGDGIADFAFASIDNSSDPAAVNGVQVALGNGDGSFAAPVGYTTTAGGSPQKIIAGDLNGDGILDLLVTNFDDPGTFSVLIGNGDGSFQAPVAFATGDLAYVAAFGDFDGDGDLDIIIGNYGDGTFEAFNNDSVSRGSSAVKAITINPLDDASIANDDSGSTVAEDATVDIDVRANDSDIDSAVEAVAQIDGQAIAIGGTVTLASGATVTRNADGTLTYDPNGAFDSLISAATASATGASNTSAEDSFLYTLAGGNAATVTVTVTGVQSAGDQLRGSNGDDDITGTSGSDIFMLHDDGDDTASGGDGVDGFFMGSSLSAGDVIDGGASNDLLGLRGNYNGYTFSATNLTGIETLVLLSGSITTYGGGSAAERFDYDLTTIDENVLPGQMFVVHGASLLAGEDLRFDGSAETDGSFFFYGGAGNDTLIGGAGNDVFASGMGQDTLTGGGGNDLFYFRLAAESPVDSPDSITDFAAGDGIQIWALGEPGGLGIRFIGDNAFSGRAGELRVTGSGTSWAVEIDVDGDGDADFAIDVTTTVSDYQWSASDFYM